MCGQQILSQFSIAAEQATQKPGGSASQPLLLSHSSVHQESRENWQAAALSPGVWAESVGGTRLG